MFDWQWSDGLPVGIVAGLLDGLFQCLVEGIGFDRYSVVVVGCVAATDGKVRHCDRLHITGIGCGFRAYGSDIDADLAAAHHDGDRAVARHEPEDFPPYRIGDGALAGFLDRAHELERHMQGGLPRSG